MRFHNGVWVADNEFTPMGQPETSVEMPGDLTLGLCIPSPFGHGTDAMLAVHATEQADTPGGIITLAITHIVERATPSTVQEREDDSA